MHKYLYFFTADLIHIVHFWLHCRKKQVPISVAIGNVELMQECFYKLWCMGTARLNYDKKTKKDSIIIKSRKLLVNVRVLGKGLELLSVNGGRFEINQLLFADDTALVADSQEKLC